MQRWRVRVSVVIASDFTRALTTVSGKHHTNNEDMHLPIRLEPQDQEMDPHHITPEFNTALKHHDDGDDCRKHFGIRFGICNVLPHLFSPLFGQTATLWP